MAESSFYYGYGVRVQDDIDTYEFQQVFDYSGLVTWISAGDYDANMQWLFVQIPGRDVVIGDGEYIKVDQFQATDGDYPDWDAALVATAEKHELNILDGPAWFFVPDCS